MKRIFLSFAMVLFVATLSSAQTPEITSWKQNRNNQVGFNNIPSNILSVKYNASNVWVGCNSVPDYVIGPWPNNPNTTSAMGFSFKITRTPQEQTSTKTETPLGHIGVWSNGVSIFNAKDGMSYNNAGIWKRNALFWEGSSFDNCLGHPQQSGEYHHHVNPKCLYDPSDANNKNVHAPIIGFAFDGYPIYGSYAYANTDGTGGIKKLKSSYQLRNITTRATLPDGTALSPSDYGPVISNQFPLGAFIEDYEYLANSGDLDIHNGRYCITPQYPNGTYAYFVTVDDANEPSYPFVIGPTYYGIVQPGNTGRNSGKNTPDADAVTYIPLSISLLSNENGFNPMIQPNPSNGRFELQFQAKRQEPVNITLVDLTGKAIYQNQTQANEGVNSVHISLEGIPAGLYSLRIELSSQTNVLKVVIE